MSEISETSPMARPEPVVNTKTETKVAHTESHSVQITNIRLNEANFLRWSQSVRMYIHRRGKIGYLTGETKATDKADLSYAIWDAENSMIMAWLVNAMDEDISANYMCYPIAKELWDNVSQMYSDLGNYSQIYELQQKIGKNQQGEDSVTKYFNVLKGQWQDLDLFNDYDWKSLDDCNYNKKMVENARIFQFLAGLNDEFDEVRGRILGRQHLPPIREVFSEKKGADGTVENSALVAANPTILAAANALYRCHIPINNLEYETCWKLHGKPENWKSSKPGPGNNQAIPKTNEAQINVLSSEQMDQLLQLLKSNPISVLL
ncbi:hypothetical protein I3842_07G008300 [Carya illinoinensis]|uniref:Retrotransposon Copia-like N-terminal domain-containing protein n=1 Tax=Carya illinoinensis TaxID=32201 RepID=A0A922EE02_CARIL|nr:hypothetical protein I3842_07G008300 [Carya illinoinensis]